MSTTSFDGIYFLIHTLRSLIFVHYTETGCRALGSLRCKAPVISSVPLTVTYSVVTCCSSATVDLRLGEDKSLTRCVSRASLYPLCCRDSVQKPYSREISCSLILTGVGPRCRWFLRSLIPRPLLSCPRCPCELHKPKFSRSRCMLLVRLSAPERRYSKVKNPIPAACIGLRPSPASSPWLKIALECIKTKVTLREASVAPLEQRPKLQWFLPTTCHSIAHPRRRRNAQRSCSYFAVIGANEGGGAC